MGFNDISTQSKITNGFLVAQSFQMSKMNQGLQNIADCIKTNIQIQASVLKIQEDIKDISLSVLNEAKKLNKLKELEITQQNLKYEQEKAEREYITFQRNLAFELKNSVEEVEESNSTNLEKFFFLKTSEDLFEDLDTEKFEISEMEYCRNAFKKIKQSRVNYENLLNEQDKIDLELIDAIEEEDENEILQKLEKDLKKILKLNYEIKKIEEIQKDLSKPSTSKKKFDKICKVVENLDL